MIPTANPTPVPSPGVSRARVAWLASIVFCGVLPAVTVVALFVSVVQDDSVAFDFRPFYSAAESILDNESPYPEENDSLAAEAGPYVYPPLGALVAIPFTVLPREVAGLLVMALLLASALAIPLVLGVRDWRCYGVALLWPPVLSAIQTGNMTLVLGLAAALAWRLRDRALSSSVVVGVSLAAKLFLWPLLVWLAATRRFAGAIAACLVGGVLLFASWAAIGFDGLREYPELLRRLEETVGLDSYTAYVVARDLGLPPTAARALWLAVGLGVLAAVLIAASRGGERSAFVFALVASLALTPIVWLHYFALLLVVLALIKPWLGVAWFVPLAMVITPGSGQPTPFETAATLAVATLTFALALRSSRPSGDRGAAAALPVSGT